MELELLRAAGSDAADLADLEQWLRNDFWVDIICIPNRRQFPLPELSKGQGCFLQPRRTRILHQAAG